jgi:hypothetical protein
MATFNYTGWATIVWPDGYRTRQYIDFNAADGTISVYSENKDKGIEYIGPIEKHNADRIIFNQ